MKEKLRRIAAEAGCAGFGVTTAEEFDTVAATLSYRDRLGLSGRRRFTYKDPERAADVRRSFPWAHSIVALSWAYLPASGSPGEAEPGTGRVARFATTDHYTELRRAARAIRSALVESGRRAEILIDDDRLVDRAAAVRAGIVWWGKSTMTLDPRHGPWLLLGSVVTNAELDPDQPMRRDCGSCDACLPSCPTGAIVAPGVLDASRCLAHWLQTAGSFPHELRVALGDRVYGCDDCLEACPPGHKQLTADLPGRGRIDLIGLLKANDATLLASYGHFYLPGRRPRILRRNAILALGNSWHGRADGSGKAEAIAALAGFLVGSDPILRAHAAWALGRIGGDEARSHLLRSLPEEADPAVVDEIDRVLQVYAAEHGETDEG
jgi:epoxyqueuosine reductase